MCIVSGNENGAATVKNSMTVPKKINNRIIDHSTSGYKSKRIESRVSEKYVHTYIHSTIILKSKKTEAT